MAVILQVSDTHFGTEQPPVADALLDLACEQRPGLLIVSGDITQRARNAQFRAARIFLDSLGIAHRLVVPGNHDIPLFDILTRFFRPYAKYAREFGGNLEPSHDSEELLAITVNTTRRYRHIDGEISPAQIERVSEQLRHARPRQLRIVVTHQPVCVLRPQDEENLLRGHKMAVRAWAAAGADLILGGHIHLPYVCPLHETLQPGTRRLWAVQAGTAVSGRIRHEAGNSVNIVRYDAENPHTIQVEQWDYQVGGRRFDIARMHVLDRDHDHGS
jgi:3',5'-cyclic AMP phosphodiesterase CpdA